MRYNAAAPNADGAALCNALSKYIIAETKSKFQTKNSGRYRNLNHPIQLVFKEVVGCFDIL